MTNQSAQKVRFVKCPKCKNILPELSDVPVYQCGGCGAFLRAKRLNNKTKGGPYEDESNTVPENELDLSNEKEAQCSSEAAISTERLIHSTELENHGIKESSYGPEPEKAVGQEHKADDESLLACINPTDDIVPTNQLKESNEFPTLTSKQNGKQLEDVTQSAEFVQQESEESSPPPPTENYDESSHSDVSCTGENDQSPMTIGNIANEEEENCGPSEDLILKPRGDTNCNFEVSPSIKLHEDECQDSPQVGYDDFGRECARDANPSVIIPSSEEPSPSHATNTDHDQHSSSSDSSLSVFRFSTDTNLEPPYSLPNKQLETIAHRSLHSISSVETTGNTKISPWDAPVPYFSYEGSVSSNDGIEDQAPFYPQRRPHQTRNFSSFEKEQTMEGKRLNPYELPEYRGYGHPVRSQNAYPKAGHRSGPCAHPHDYRSFNYGSTSTCGCNDLKHNLNSDIINQVKYAEDKKMELLEMINELQDQINDIHLPMENVKGKLTNGCATNRERRPPFHNPILAGETYSQDTNYSRRKIHSRECQISRMAFSAEAPFSRHQPDPRTWHYSAELPPCQIHSSEGNYTYNTRIGCNCRRSGLLDPQDFSGSDSLLMSPDWKYDDICNRNNNVMKNLIKDRLHSGKKHVRPTVGGAPFVVCYHCKKLLQLPTDFIVFKNKKSHRLRCGYCSHVLRFSFENDNCMVPKTEKTSGVVAPPPSEVNTQSGGRSYTESRRIRIRETRKISNVGTSSMEINGERSVPPVVERPHKGMPSSSKIQKVKAASSMSLHKLMGYSSPSQVFFRGKSSGQKRTPS